MSDDKPIPAVDETVKQASNDRVSLDGALDTYSFTDGITDDSVGDRQLDGDRIAS